MQAVSVCTAVRPPAAGSLNTTPLLSVQQPQYYTTTHYALLLTRTSTAQLQAGEDKLDTDNSHQSHHQPETLSHPRIAKQSSPIYSVQAIWNATQISSLWLEYSKFPFLLPLEQNKKNHVNCVALCCGDLMFNLNKRTIKTKLNITHKHNTETAHRLKVNILFPPWHEATPRSPINILNKHLLNFKLTGQLFTSL